MIHEVDSAPHHRASWRGPVPQDHWHRGGPHNLSTSPSTPTSIALAWCITGHAKGFVGPAFRDHWLAATSPLREPGSPVALDVFLHVAGGDSSLEQLEEVAASLQAQLRVYTNATYPRGGSITAAKLSTRSCTTGTRICIRAPTPCLQ